MVYDTKSKPYGIFSNFYERKITYNNIEYFTSEGYFQAEKFLGYLSNSADRNYSKLISDQKTGGKAAMLARQKCTMNYGWTQDLKILIDKSIKDGVYMRPDWENIKDNVMRRAVFIKFTILQNDGGVKSCILLETENKLIFEHTHRDKYWADGHPSNNPNIHGDGKKYVRQNIRRNSLFIGWTII